MSGYGPKELEGWAAKVRAWQKGTEPAKADRIGKKAPRVKGGRDVYVFFDNDAKVRAPVDARNLAKKLGIGPTETTPQVLKELGVTSGGSSRRGPSKSRGKRGR